MAVERTLATSLGAAVLDGRGSLAQKLLLGFGLALIGSLVIAVSARVQVPFYPVPMTMQTFAVTLVAAAYGARLGGAVMLLYLAEGALGLPVFANTPERGLGLAYMLGPTGGYLLGFVPAAAVVGWLTDRRPAPGCVRMTVAMLAGVTVIYFCGAIWFASLMHTGLRATLMIAVLPFVPMDAAKALAAAWAVSAFLGTKREDPAEPGFVTGPIDTEQR